MDREIEEIYTLYAGNDYNDAVYGCDIRIYEAIKVSYLRLKN